MIHDFMVQEPLGRSWESQWTTHHIELPPGKWRGERLQIQDETGTPISGGVWPQGRHADGSVSEARVAVYAAFEPDQARFFRLAQTDDPKSATSTIRAVERGDGTVLLVSDLFEVVAPNGDYSVKDDNPVPPPVLAIRRVGGEWVGRGSFAGTEGFQTCTATHVVEEDYRIQSTVVYQTGSGSPYTVRIELLAHEPVIRVEESFHDVARGAFEIDLSDGLAATHAHMACHRASKHHRSLEGEPVYPIWFEEENTLWLQPFYCWNDDIGTLWGGYAQDGEYVGIVPTHASKWERPIYNRIQVVAAPGPSLRARFPLDQGTRSWMMTIQLASEVEAEKGKGEVFLRSLLVRLADLPLQKVLGMQLTWKGDDEISHPHLLCSSADVEPLRRKLRTDSDFAAVMQPDRHQNHYASVYLATGDKDAAAKARKRLLEFLQTSLDGFFQGGYSGSGVVAISFHRPLRTNAIDYDLIADSAVMTDEDRIFCRSAFSFIAHVMVDRDYWPTLEQGFSRGNINFNSDMYTALAAVAGLSNHHPKQPEWMQYVVDEMEDEFRRQVYPGKGVWSESPTYHLHSIHYLLIAAAILQKNGYQDFSKNPNLRATIDYSFKIQTPFDIRAGYHMMPTVGDTAGSFAEQGLQTIYAWMASLAKDDPEFASRMMYAWQRAGRSVSCGPWACSLFLVDPDIEPKRPDPPLASEHLPGYGAVLRNRWDADEETYLLFKMGYVSQHFDADEGSFHWYARGVPLSMDWGCMYQPSITQPWMHSSVAFGGRRTWNQGEVKQFVSLEGADLLEGVLTTTDVQTVDDMPGTPPEKSVEKKIERQVTLVHWERRLVLVRGPDYVVLRDDFDDPTGENDTLWSLPVMAESLSIEKDRARFTGQFGVDLEVVFGAPGKLTLSNREWGYKLPDMWENQIVLHSWAPSGESHLACLFPYQREEPRSAITPYHGKAFRVKTPDRDDVVVLSRDKVHVEVDRVEAFARAAVISRRKDVTEIHLLDGDFVRIPRLDLFFTGPVRMEVRRGQLRGECEGQPRSCFLRWTPPPLEPAELLLDGKPHPVYHTFDGYLEFSVSEGKHTFEVVYPREVGKE
jgi:hypothetical protein